MKKLKSAPRHIDKNKHKAFTERTDSLKNGLSKDEAVVFGVAIPKAATHSKSGPARTQFLMDKSLYQRKNIVDREFTKCLPRSMRARPFGGWTLKDEPSAMAPTIGPHDLNIHGVFDLKNELREDKGAHGDTGIDLVVVS